MQRVEKRGIVELVVLLQHVAARVRVEHHQVDVRLFHRRVTLVLLDLDGCLGVVEFAGGVHRLHDQAWKSGGHLHADQGQRHRVRHADDALRVLHSPDHPQQRQHDAEEEGGDQHAAEHVFVKDAGVDVSVPENEHQHDADHQRTPLRIAHDETAHAVEDGREEQHEAEHHPCDRQSRQFPDVGQHEVERKDERDQIRIPSRASGCHYDSFRRKRSNVRPECGTDARASRLKQDENVSMHFSSVRYPNSSRLNIVNR